MAFEESVLLEAMYISVRSDRDGLSSTVRAVEKVQCTCSYVGGYEGCRGFTSYREGSFLHLRTCCIFPSVILGAAANSDHYFFTQKGVPAFFMYTMGPNKHYHDVYDTYDELSFSKFNAIYQLLIDFEKVVSWKR